ncbi:MAG: flavin oxidoreductase [Bacteroidetes bacterium]|nr:MAG: flavin oxidoreductase [Bacteroidota bacterium]
MQLNKAELEALERKYRLNLINSISGVKPANLIGTKSAAGQENLAIFSSVVHLGSNPAELGFVLRPQSEPPRDTYANILSSGYYTINHISASFIQKAHYTSAKLERGESEFERMKLESEYLSDFFAPFVKASAVKLGMKHQESILLPNGCTFVMGSVELLHAAEASINDLGQLDLADYQGVGIGGLNTYYGLQKLDSFPYVREDEIPDFQA